MKLAESKNPSQESKVCSFISLAMGMASLLLWFLAIASLAFGVRGIILAKRVNNLAYIGLSAIGLVLSFYVLCSHFL
jgi:hypothetical protein